MDISTASSVLLSSTILSVTTMDFDSHWLWALVLAFHLSFLFAFAMGANEVSNAFATSVGSGAISLFTAYFLATFFESAGGVLLGYKVLETLRFKVIDLEVYEGAQEEFLLGQIAILAGCSLWMFLATLLRLPVSSTHAHVGSIIGFSLFMRGTKGLHLDWVFTIIISWIVSPILSGIVSAILYILMDFWVLRRKEPLKRAFQALPIIYFLVFAFNTFIVLYQGTKWLHFDKIPFWLAFVIAIAVGIISAIVFKFIVKPLLLKWLKRKRDAVVSGTTVALDPFSTPASSETASSEIPLEINQSPPPAITQRFDSTPRGFLRWLLPDRLRRDDQQTLGLFSVIQVFSGCFTGFSHGSKDIPNTIAPLANFLFVFNTVKVPPGPMETPLWILAYGAFGTCVGFWIMGHRVIKTVGTKFTEINPYCGFVVELGSAITVVIASKLGIPVSLSLCIVGSVVAVGMVRGSVPVNWPLFRNVFIAWVVTFPLSGLFSVIFMAILKYFFL